MNKEKINEYVKSISNNLDDKIKIINSIQYYYDLEKLIFSSDKLSDDEEEKVLEELINEKLLQIKKVGNVDKFRESNKLVDEVTDFFYNNNEEDAAIVEEGSCVASDLVLKALGEKGRKIELPLKISFIKEYCISNIIDEKDIRKTLLWIVLELSVVSYFFNN